VKGTDDDRVRSRTATCCSWMEGRWQSLRCTRTTTRSRCPGLIGFRSLPEIADQVLMVKDPSRPTRPCMVGDIPSANREKACRTWLNRPRTVVTGQQPAASRSCAHDGSSGRRGHSHLTVRSQLTDHRQTDDVRSLPACKPRPRPGRHTARKYSNPRDHHSPRPTGRSLATCVPGPSATALPTIHSFLVRPNEIESRSNVTAHSFGTKRSSAA
jgi:hypothetical protein